MAFSLKGLFGRKNAAQEFPHVTSSTGEARTLSGRDLCADSRLGVAFDVEPADFEATAQHLVASAAAQPAFHESGIGQYPRTLVAELGAYMAQVDACFVRYCTELETVHRASLVAELECIDSRLTELAFARPERAAARGKRKSAAGRAGVAKEGQTEAATSTSATETDA